MGLSKLWRHVWSSPRGYLSLSTLVWMELKNCERDDLKTSRRFVECLDSSFAPSKLSWFYIFTFSKFLVYFHSFGFVFSVSKQYIIDACDFKWHRSLFNAPKLSVYWLLVFVWVKLQLPRYYNDISKSCPRVLKAR